MIIVSKATMMERMEHSPTLNTVLMVENVIKNARDSIISIPEIKRTLPKQINHNTLMIILEYLEESGKIAVTMKGITWIHNTNPNLKKTITRMPKIKDRDSDVNNLEQIKSDISPILKSSGVSKAAIFGSVARGEARSKSDIDILVEFSKPKGLGFISLKLALEEKLKRKVDLLTYASINPYIKKKILTEAVRIL